MAAKKPFKNWEKWLGFVMVGPFYYNCTSFPMGKQFYNQKPFCLEIE
jgi:hypothetical protein